MEEAIQIPTAVPMETPVEATIEAEGAPGTPPPAKAEPKPEPKAPELYEVKINGRTQKLTLDQLRAKASLADAAHEKFEEASKIGKKAQARDEALKKDFLSALMDPELGLTKDQIRVKMESWYKKNFIDPETLTPDQLELNELRELKQKQIEDAKTQSEKQAAEEENQRLEMTRNEMQQEIIQTLDTSGLPKNRFTVARIAYWQQQNLAKGYDAPSEVVIQQVKDETSGIVRANLKSASIEQLQELMAEDFDGFVKKLRAHDMENLKKRFSGQEVATPTKPRNLGPKRVTMSDVDRNLKRLRQGF